MDSLNELNWFEKLMLKRICRKTVFQGDHQLYITKFFLTFIEHSQAEFTEDNIVTHEDFLQECFSDALTQSRLEYNYQALENHRWYDAVLIDGQKTRFTEKYDCAVESVIEDSKK